MKEKLDGGDDHVVGLNTLVVGKTSFSPSKLLAIKSEHIPDSSLPSKQNDGDLLDKKG